MKIKPWHIGLALSASSKNTLASIGTTVAATAVFSEMGFDIWPLLIGGAACTIVHAYKAPATRMMAFSNSIICIFLGWIVAPWLAARPYVSEYIGTEPEATYVVAGLLAAAWPWIFPMVFDFVRNLLDELRKSIFSSITFWKKDKNE